MKVKDLDRYSNAEKIILAEQLWDSISKKDLEISNEIKSELDIRLKKLEEGKTKLYSLEEIRARIKTIR